MLSKLQFNILFYVGVGGAITLLFGPEVGIDVGKNPLAATGVGAILTYVLTQKDTLTKDHNKKNKEKEEEEDNGATE